MDSAHWPPVAERKTTSHRLPLAVLSISVGVAIVTIVVTPREGEATRAAAQAQAEINAQRSGAAGDRAAAADRSGGPTCQPAPKDAGGPAGAADAVGLSPRDPPAPELPNKFELSKFDEPSHPDYALAKASRSASHAVRADGVAPRLPQAVSQTAAWQVLEESYSLARADAAPATAAEAPPE